MDALQTLITAEKTRLTALQKIPMTEGIATSSQCAKLVSEGKLKEAQDLLAQSQILWPANIENTQLKLRLDDLAKSQAASTAEAAVASQTAATAPKKVTPSSTPTVPVKP
jgi:SUMO ligase MMS21 Smc5/6 complex component